MRTQESGPPAPPPSRIQGSTPPPVPSCRGSRSPTLSSSPLTTQESRPPGPSSFEDTGSHPQNPSFENAGPQLSSPLRTQESKPPGPLLLRVSSNPAPLFLSPSLSLFENPSLQSPCPSPRGPQRSPGLQPPPLSELRFLLPSETQRAGPLPSPTPVARTKRGVRSAPGKATGGYATRELGRAPGTAPAPHQPADPQRPHTVQTPPGLRGASALRAHRTPAQAWQTHLGPRLRAARRAGSSRAVLARGPPRVRHAYPAQHASASPASFGAPAGLRGPGPAVQRPAGSGLSREGARTGHRELESAAGHGLGSTELRACKGAGLRARKAVGPEASGTEGSDRTWERGGAWSSAFGMRWSLRFRFLGTESGGGLEAGPQASVFFGGSRLLKVSVRM